MLPNIADEYTKERAKDEMPQSGTGKTVMTTEPKFVPGEAVEVTFNNNIKAKLRLIDCVGYMIPGAIGNMEGEIPRLVSTPWNDEPIPFAEAAEIGTRKVINDHSTIGVLVTTDGSITDINRDNYIMAEERVVRELKEINKPFVIILNTTHPNNENTVALSVQLKEKYDAPVLVVDCMNVLKAFVAPALPLPYSLTSFLAKIFPNMYANDILPMKYDIIVNSMYFILPPQICIVIISHPDTGTKLLQVFLAPVSEFDIDRCSPVFKSFSYFILKISLI
jgi:hypothetical protein